MAAKKRSAGPRYYAVARGRKVGIYSTWDECNEQVNGFSGAKYKSFASREDAKSFISSSIVIVSDGPTRTNDSLQAVKAASTTVKRKADDDDAAQCSSASVKKRAPVRSSVDAEPDAEEISAIQASGVRVIVAYTDGASSSNGRTDARAGWGVHFPAGLHDPQSDLHGLDESARLPGQLQTNNRAELMAIIRAIQLSPDPQAMLFIYTDSQYCINAMQQWQHKWRQAGWKRGVGSAQTDVLNRDLIRRLECEMRKCVHRPRLKHVKGHASSKGNIHADRLAVAGAALPPVPQDEWQDMEPEKSDNEDKDEGKHARKAFANAGFIIPKDKT